MNNTPSINNTTLYQFTGTILPPLAEVMPQPEEDQMAIEAEELTQIVRQIKEGHTVEIRGSKRQEILKKNR